MEILFGLANKIVKLKQVYRLIRLKHYGNIVYDNKIYILRLKILSSD